MLHQSGYNGEAMAATSAYLNQPTGIAFDASGNMFITEDGNSIIRKVDTSSPPLIATVAGTPQHAGFSGDHGPAENTTATSCTDSNACLNFGPAGPFPSGIAIDAAGNKYVADSANNVIRMVTPGGIITTAYGTAYTSFSGNIITSCQYDGPGGSYLASSAVVRFCVPSDVLFDKIGNLYITDYGNHVVRKVSYDIGPPQVAVIANVAPPVC